MTYDIQKLTSVADDYCRINHSKVARLLGRGTQGIVFQTVHNTALKIHAREDAYLREIVVYRRLTERKITSIRGFQIPRFLNSDDNLFALEISIVHVPCVLDFGSSHDDEPPEYLGRDEDWLNEKQEEFGDRWEEAQSIISELEYKAGIWLADVNVSNIKFSES